MFLTDNAKVDGTPNKAKLNEKYTFVFILFQVLKILLIVRYSDQLFYFSLFSINFYINRYHFYSILALHSTLSEKRFLSGIFLFFNRFTPVPTQHPSPPRSAKHDESLFFYYTFCLAATVEETVSLIQC